MEFKIVTFNLRYLYDGDGVNSFIHRSGMICRKIRSEKADVIGFQEAIPQSVDDLIANLPEYHIIYNGRDADLGGEGLALAIRKDTVELMNFDVFWLSETPYVPGSRNAVQSSCPRICQQALVRLGRSNQTCWIFNNHLDHFRDDMARVLEIKQVLERVKECKAKWDSPVFVLGDLNSLPDSEVIDCCKQYNPVKLTDLTADSGPTFHGFGKAPVCKKIDYIFSDVSAKAYKTECWKEERNGIYLSDHYPISVSLEM